MCFIQFLYKGELHKSYTAPPKVSAEKLSEFLDGQWLTFKGMGVFVEGVLSGGPAFFINGDGRSYSFSWMKDGRPANGCLERAYWPEGWQIPVTSANTKSDASGCIQKAVHVDSNRDRQGLGKKFWDDGNVEQGIFKDNAFD